MAEQAASALINAIHLSNDNSQQAHVTVLILGVLAPVIQWPRAKSRPLD